MVFKNLTKLEKSAKDWKLKLTSSPVLWTIDENYVSNKNYILQIEKYNNFIKLVYCHRSSINLQRFTESGRLEWVKIAPKESVTSVKVIKSV